MFMLLLATCARIFRQVFEMWTFVGFLSRVERSREGSCGEWDKSQTYARLETLENCQVHVNSVFPRHVEEKCFRRDCKPSILCCRGVSRILLKMNDTEEFCQRSNIALRRVSKSRAWFIYDPTFDKRTWTVHYEFMMFAHYSTFPKFTRALSLLIHNLYVK